MIIKDDNTQNAFSLIADFEGDMDALIHTPFDEKLPVLPLRNMMLFPGVVGSVTVGRQSSLKVVEQAAKKGSLIAVLAQKDAAVEEPVQNDLYDQGAIARVMRTIDLPNGNVVAILQSYGPALVKEVKKNRGQLQAELIALEEVLYDEKDKEFEALVDSCRDIIGRYLKLTDFGRSEEAAFAVGNIKHPVYLINFICTNLQLSPEERYSLFLEHDIKQRAYQLLRLLNREVQFAVLKRNIQESTRDELDQQQKEYFLHQQIKHIQSELGDDENGDVADLMRRAEAKKLPEKVAETFKREVDKLKRINPQAPEYNVQLNYLQTITDLPWGIKTEDNYNIKNAERVLNRDHYGLERVKERILEHLATLHYGTHVKAPIICLYGPPGVGKTSLGKSIAEAIGRKYVRISLGGVSDEAEIRGHRRTYIGAMPGRIVKNLIKAGSNNPVMVLDEIDKVSERSNNGDPQSALLEVLDPEQNSTFHDNFLDMDYDLSNVLFIATANTLQTIPGPLLDRMELIEVEGYLTEEKKEIARRHLVRKEQANYDFGEDAKINLPAPTIEYIIERYTRESGVRQLEKQIQKIFRKVAYLTSISEDGMMPYKGVKIKPADIEKLLGKPIFSRDKYQGNRYAGVVTGLAWTAVGGEILFIETSVSRSKGGKLTLTGNLGDVMKESAVLALEYIKAHADTLHIDYRVFDNWGIHIHVPEGATPKDGPSAGITIATSIASVLTQRKVRNNLAMTGEITLRGKVLPVGGIKEKILAAKRAGITDIVISVENKKDIEEINERYVAGLTFHFVEDVQEVFAFALLDEKVEHAIELVIPETPAPTADSTAKSEFPVQLMQGK